MKKTLLFVIFVTVLYSEAFAYYDFAIGVFYYKITSGNKVMVTYPSNNSSDPYSGYYKPSGNITIPSSVTYGTTTYTVTSINQWTFYGCSGLTSITIPSSVTGIGACAFKDCSGLISIIVDSGNSVLDSRDNCNAIIHTATNKLIVGCKTTVIPNTVTSIGDCAFLGCSSLTSISIPNSVTTICQCAFQNCSGLTTVSIGSSVTTIGLGAFSGCNSLASINIPNSVTTIGNKAFRDCHNLISIVIPDLVTNIGIGTFYGCNGLTSVIFGNSVSIIDSAAFQNCSSLTSIVLPNSLTTIGSYAFQNCSGLTSIIIPNSVTSIGNRAFSYCTGLTSVTIGESVTNINDYAFYYCSALTSVNYNATNCTQMGSSAYPMFNNCSNLTSINVGANVVRIPSYAFYGCNDMTEITSHAVVAPMLGYNTFYQVSSVLPVNIPCGSTASYQSRWGYCFSNLIEPIIPSITVGSMDNTMGHAEVLSGTCDSVVVIEATGNYGHHFTQWNDGNANNPRTIILTQDTSFTAQFAKNQYTVNVVPSHTERGSVTGGNTVDYLDSITITATANYGYHFDHWNDMNTDNPRQVQVTQDQTYTAYFAPNQYSLTVQSASNSNWGSVSGGGNYDYLSSRTIMAHANHGYHFTQWNDSYTDTLRTVILTQDTIFTAQFAKNQYTVNVAASHSDRGSVTGGGTVDYLDSVTVTATSNYGYHFDHWSDGSTDNPHTIAVTQNATITAYFEPDLFTITLQSANPSYGYVEVDSIRNFYLSSNTFSAIPNYGYHFTHWDDGVAESTRTITLTQDTSFTAHFAPNQYTLMAVSADETMGTVSGGGTYDYGNTITVTANPVEHYHFLHWNDGNTDNPRTVVIEGDRTLTAFFAIDTYTVRVTVNDISRGMVEASGTEFVYGTPCTVTATAYSGYVFSHWSNNVTYNPYTFAVMEDVELTAIFVEEGTQGISDVSDINGFKVYTKGCSIHINGIEGQYVSVYSVDGRIITTKQNATEQESISVPSTGVYFIKVGEYPARKVVVLR